MKEMGMLEEKTGKEGYLNILMHQGEFDHRMDKPFQSFVSNVLDIFWESFTSIAGSFLEGFVIAAAGALMFVFLPAWAMFAVTLGAAAVCVILVNTPEETVPGWLKGAKETADAVGEEAVKVMKEGPGVLVKDIVL